MLEDRLAPLDETGLRRAWAAAEPFPSLVIDGFLAPAFAREVVHALPSFEQARSQGREFSAVNERGKVQVTQAEHFPPAIRALHEVFAAPGLLAALERITGVKDLLADDELVGGGIHVMAPGAHLDVHVDFNCIAERGIYRRLNALLFLNERWDESWGGELELWDEHVARRHHVFTPRLNRLVLFETSERSFHGVRKVTSPPGAARRSFAVYYYTREAAPGQAASHDTLFRARPDERFKGRVLMPAERAWSNAREELRRIARVAKRSLIRR
jgi:Rps23 Pro-64 3,4-dihydroxylase Tpa1-like proline 4-hydroxylase